jgi:hypothetical protein
MKTPYYYIIASALPFLYFIFAGSFSPFSGTGKVNESAYVQAIKKAQEKITPEAKDAISKLASASQKYYKEKKSLPKNQLEIAKYIDAEKLEEVDFKQFTSIKYRSSYTGKENLEFELKCVPHFTMQIDLAE